jgi:hypothetical protein
MTTENKIDYEDYFFTKYNSEISDLFLEIKEITDGFCLDLFNTSEQTQYGSFNLCEFIFEKIILDDEIDEELIDNIDEIEHYEF